MDSMQPGKIEITAIDDIERTRFDGNLIKNVHVVDLSMGYDNNGRDTAS